MFAFSIFRNEHLDNKDIPYTEKINALVDSIEFVELNHTLNLLKIQKDKLENTSLQDSATLLDKQKSALISGVYNCIIQTTYSMQAKLDKNTDRSEVSMLKAKYELVDLCAFNVTHILSDDFSEQKLKANLAILAAHRDGWRNYSIFHYGAVGTAVVMGGPASLLGAVGLGLASHLGLRLTENIVGLDAETKSLKLVMELFAGLSKLSNRIKEKLERVALGEYKIISDNIWKEILEINPSIKQSTDFR